MKIGYRKANTLRSVGNLAGIPLSLFLALAVPQLIFFAAVLFIVSLVGGFFLNAVCTCLEDDSDKSHTHLGAFIIALGGFYLLAPKSIIAMPMAKVAMISIPLILFGTLLVSAPKIARRWFYDDRE